MVGLFFMVDLEIDIQGYAEVRRMSKIRYDTQRRVIWKTPYYRSRATPHQRDGRPTQMTKDRSLKVATKVKPSATGEMKAPQTGQ